MLIMRVVAIFRASYNLGYLPENASHYELEGYEIEGSVLKKCHLNRVASVRFEKFKGCPSTGL